MRNRMLIAILLAMVMSAAACAAEGGDVGTPSPTPSATTGSPSPDPSSTESPSPTPSPELEDGRHFGYIESVDIRTLPGTMVFDLAYFLTGDEANQAAEEHGDETPVPSGADHGRYCSSIAVTTPSLTVSQYGENDPL